MGLRDNFRARGVMAVVALNITTAVASAGLLDFTQQQGSTAWGDYAVGSVWTFSDVQPGVDMVLTLDGLTPETDLMVHPLGDQLKVTVRGRDNADRFAAFSATFVDAALGGAVALDPQFLLTDIDYQKGHWAEQAWFDHVDSYTLMNPTHLDVQTAGNVVTATGTSLNTNGRDQRAWVGLDMLETPSFQFGWGFTGLAGGGGSVAQRGLEFGGTAVVDLSGGSKTDVPEPASLALLAMCLLLRKR